MRKLLALALTLTFIFVVAGCSNKDGGSSGGSENGGKEKITVWGWDVAADTLKLAVEGFNEKYPDVEVVVEDFGSGDLYEKLTVGLVSKGSGMPDVVLVEDERIPGYISQFPDGFESLTERGYDQYKDLFGAAKLGGVTHDGEIIAAPWDIGPTGVFYRVDLFEEAGVNVEDIVTWDDYIEAGLQIKDKLNVKMLPIDISNYDGVFNQMLQQQGTSYFNNDGDIDLTSPEAVRAMETVKKLYDNDLVLNNSGWNGIVTATVNGDVATVPYGAWYTGTIMDQAPDDKGKWGMFFLPEFKEGSTRYGNVGGASLMVSAYSKNKDAAYAFTEFFTTDVDTQLLGFEKYGLFPSLQSVYDAPIMTEENEYFNNQPIFKQFADIVDEIPEIHTTKYNAQAAKIMADTQARVLLENAPIDKALEDAKKQLQNEIKE